MGNSSERKTGAWAQGGRGSATLTDVARRAGVSRNTVSNAINRKSVVKEETRQRVMQAVQDLGYRPNLTARSLVTGRTNCIGVIMPSTPRVLYKFFLAEVMNGIMDEAAELSYNVFINTEAPGAGRVVDLGLFRDSRIDGGLLVDDGRLRIENIGEIERAEIPFVVVDYDLNRPNASWVVIDKREGARCVCQHLLSSGCGNIAFLHGILDRQDHRLQGFKEAIGEAGIEYDPALVVDVRGDWWDEAKGYSAMLELLARGRTFDAVFSSGVALALGAWEALGRLRPDLHSSVRLGCMGNRPHGSWVGPGMVVAEQPNYEAGRAAVAAVVGLIEGTRSSPVRETLRPRLVVDP